MNVIVVGGGHVGAAVVEALHRNHELTVIDLDGERLGLLSERFDVLTLRGNGASGATLRAAGIAEADLVIACTSNEELNLLAAMLAKRLSGARTVARTTNLHHLDAWRESQIDIDFMVSSELETANAILRIFGAPAARQADSLADDVVRVVEFDVPAGVRAAGLLDTPLREARIPADSRVAMVIRDGHVLHPGPTETIRAGDRIAIIGSPAAAREWSRLLADEDRRPDKVVIFGAGRVGTAVARILLRHGTRVLLVESQPGRAHAAADELPQARVHCSTGLDGTFLKRERIDAASAVFCMKDDAKNLYGAILAKVHGVRFTIGVIAESTSASVFERGGVDVTVNPRQATAAAMVRFAHDERIRQLVMLEDDRFEVIDVAVRAGSAIVDRSLRDLPVTGTVIGAIVRDGRAIFPHAGDVVRPGDRLIVCTASERAGAVAQAL
jgi:trk system potassium uptake protein TrkA